MSEQVVQTYITWTHGAADVVTDSRTWSPAGQTHSADYVASAPAKFPTASATSASSTTTTTGDSTPAVYALSTEHLDLSSSWTIMPCYIEIAAHTPLGPQH